MNECEETVNDKLISIINKFIFNITTNIKKTVIQKYFGNKIGFLYVIQEKNVSNDDNNTFEKDIWYSFNEGFNKGKLQTFHETEHIL